MLKTFHLIPLIVLINLLNALTTDYPIATTTKPRYENIFDEDIEDNDNYRKSRGMENHQIDEQKAVKEDPWAGYYDFIINEGSFKFWAVFQLFTALLLIYSAFAAVYYAKFNVITTDYDYYDDFFGRSNTEDTSISSSMGYLWSGLSSQTFQRILNAISSKKYS